MNSTIELAEGPDGEGRFVIRGAINFETVLSLNQYASGQFPRFNRIIVDLSGVTYVNSAGLALLLEWQRNATVDGRKMEIHGIPQKLLNIARISELDEILPIQDTTGV